MTQNAELRGGTSQSRLPLARGIVLVAIATFFGSWFAEFLNYATDDVTLFWPPTGICIALLLIGGVRLWPGVLIGGALTGVYINDDPILVSSTMSGGAALEAAVGALLLERIAKFHRNFDRQRDVFFFILFAVLVAPAIGVTVQFACLFLDPNETLVNYGFTWLTWWIGNGAGALVAAPVILTFWDRRPPRYGLDARMLEAVLLGAAIVISGAVAFGSSAAPDHTGLPLAFLPFPFLVWAALRFGPKGATLASLSISLTAVWGSAMGSGPFIRDNLNESVFLLWGYMIAIAFSALLIAAILAQRLQALEALGKSERIFRLFMDHFPGLALIRDGDHRHIYVNSTFKEAHNLTEKEVLGKTNQELFKDGNADTFDESDRAVLESGEAIELEERTMRNGEERYLLVNKFPIQDEEGEVVLMGGITLDITEQKRAEKERREFEEQVQQSQKLESLGLLAGGIAHDFNNLLLGILGNADLARLEKGQSGTERNHLDEIIVSARRAAELCNQLLAYSGKGRFLVQVVDLSNVAEEMAALLEVSISKKAALTYDFARDLPAIEVDVTQLRQVVMNLITNASDALGNVKGAITVRTGAMECDAAYLGGSFFDDDLPEGRYVFLEVEDSGCGMDEETARLIFDPFFTSKGMGRGLGLAAVSGIVRGHLGQIRVSSVPGEGSTIRVLLPASEQQAAVVASDHAGDGDLTGSGTILVVDDEESVRILCTRILERAGFQVLTAADGREGVEQYREHGETISAVLLDMTMPNLNGEETFEELQRLRQDVRVILSSGFTEQETADRFARKGLAGFIQKPYRSADLILAIRRVLDN